MLGGLGLFLPQVFGVGYPAMDSALRGDYGLALLADPGGGQDRGRVSHDRVGRLGWCVRAVAVYRGDARHRLWHRRQRALPGAIAPAGAYGLVGMGAVFAGAARAPITSVIILFELTGDYRIILPLMLAVVLSTLVSEALSRDTIYTLKLRRRGIDLRAGRDVDLMRAVPVAQAMTSQVAAAREDISVTEAAEQLEQSGDRTLIVLDARGAVDAIATLKDIEVALLDNQPGLTLAHVASRPVVTVYADESLSQAVHTMGVHDVGQLPVVARAQPDRVIGMLRRDRRRARLQPRHARPSRVAGASSRPTE